MKGEANDLMKKYIGLNSVIQWLIKKNISKAVHAQGMGHQTPDQINLIAEGNLTAISDFLGETSVKTF